MNRIQKIIIGTVLVIVGIALYAYYDQGVKPEQEAEQLLREGKIYFEHGDKDSLKKAIDFFNRIIVEYQRTSCVGQAYVLTGQAYEKLGLHRLAYLRYSYVVKNTKYIEDNELGHLVLSRLAHLKIIRNNAEEGIAQLYDILHKSQNPQLRSRIYYELGHAHLKKGDLRSARRLFEVALREDGDNEEAVLGKARVLKRLGKDEATYNEYDYFLQHFGTFSAYTHDVKRAYRTQAYQSALAQFRKGNYIQAINFLRRVQAHFPGHKINENVLYWLGECFQGLGRYQKAIAFFNKTLTNTYYHKDQDARIKKGYVYFLQKDFEKAAREFELYLHHYADGKYAAVAQKWKDMSMKELQYRLEYHDNNNAETEDSPRLFEQEKSNTLFEDNEQLGYEEGETIIDGNAEVQGFLDTQGIILENVTEL